MRIAVVGTISYSMVSFRGPLLRALAKAGHEVYAFAMDYSMASEEQVRELGAIPVRYALDRTGTNPFRDLHSIFLLRSLFRGFAIELVFSYFIKPIIYATIAAQLAGVRKRYALLPGMGYVFTESGRFPDCRHRALNTLLRGLLRYVFAKNERVFVYNTDDEQELQKLNLATSVQLKRVNGTGIDLQQYPQVAGRTSPVTFLLAARLLKEKGIREYAKAARSVKVKYPEARFILLGGIDTNPGAINKDEVQAWVEEGVLEWPGYVTDIKPWLADSSVYVLPSYREGVPRSTQEALATGRPVITTYAPGCKDTVCDGVNGFLVPIRDVEALAERMIRFITQPELIKTMGDASRRLAEERFNVHAINRSLLEVMGL